MKDKEQSSKGSVDNLKTLKNRKERKGGMRDVQASSRPQKQAGDGGEYGYKGGRYVSLARSLVASSKALDMISNSTRVKSENRGQTCSRLVHVLRSELLRPSISVLATDEQPYAAELTPVGRISGAFAMLSARSHSWPFVTLQSAGVTQLRCYLRV